MPKILVVDDDRAIVEALTIQLKKEESPGSEHTTRGKRPS